MTSLPSRDIPRNTDHIVNDEKIKANYMPNDELNDYIKEQATKEAIVKEAMQNQNKNDNMDYLFGELQQPILMGILYFLFRQRYIDKLLLRVFPLLYKENGHHNFYGYIVLSVLYGSNTDVSFVRTNPVDVLFKLSTLPFETLIQDDQTKSYLLDLLSIYLVFR